MSPCPGPVQHLDAMGNLTRRPTEEDKAEEIKKKLEKRKIPADNWQFYIKAPESWDFNDIAPSGLSRGRERFYKLLYKDKRKVDRSDTSKK